MRTRCASCLQRSSFLAWPARSICAAGHRSPAASLAMEALLPLVQMLVASGSQRSRRRRRRSRSASSGSSSPRLTLRQWRRLDAAHSDTRGSPGHAGPAAATGSGHGGLQSTAATGSSVPGDNLGAAACATPAWDAQASCASAWHGTHSGSWGKPDCAWQTNTDSWHQDSQSGSSTAWSKSPQSGGNASWSKRPHSGGNSWSKQPRRDGNERWNERANTSGESWSTHPRRLGAAPKWGTKRGVRGSGCGQTARRGPENPSQEEPETVDVFPSMETRDEDWWFLARESGKIDPGRPLSCAEIVQATLLEPDQVKLEECVELLQGRVRRAPRSVLYDVAETFGKAGVDIGTCESWTETGFGFLRANIETVRTPDIWSPRWYSYTFLHGTTLPKVACMRHTDFCFGGYFLLAYATVTFEVFYPSTHCRLLTSFTRTWSGHYRGVIRIIPLTLFMLASYSPTLSNGPSSLSARRS